MISQYYHYVPLFWGNGAVIHIILPSIRGCVSLSLADAPSFFILHYIYPQNGYTPLSLCSFLLFLWLLFFISLLLLLLSLTLPLCLLLSLPVRFFVSLFSSFYLYNAFAFFSPYYYRYAIISLGYKHLSSVTRIYDYPQNRYLSCSSNILGYKHFTNIHEYRCHR